MSFMAKYKRFLDHVERLPSGIVKDSINQYLAEKVSETITGTSSRLATNKDLQDAFWNECKVGIMAKLDEEGHSDRVKELSTFFADFLEAEKPKAMPFAHLMTDDDYSWRREQYETIKRLLSESSNDAIQNDSGLLGDVKDFVLYKKDDQKEVVKRALKVFNLLADNKILNDEQKLQIAIQIMIKIFEDLSAEQKRDLYYQGIRVKLVKHMLDRKEEKFSYLRAASASVRNDSFVNLDRAVGDAAPMVEKAPEEISVVYEAVDAITPEIFREALTDIVNSEKPAAKASAHIDAIDKVEKLALVQRRHFKDSLIIGMHEIANAAADQKERVLEQLTLKFEAELAVDIFRKVRGVPQAEEAFKRYMREHSLEQTGQLLIALREKVIVDPALVYLKGGLITKPAINKFQKMFDRQVEVVRAAAVQDAKWSAMTQKDRHNEVLEHGLNELRVKALAILKSTESKEQKAESLSTLVKRIKNGLPEEVRPAFLTGQKMVLRDIANDLLVPTRRASSVSHVSEPGSVASTHAAAVDELVMGPVVKRQSTNSTQPNAVLSLLTGVASGIYGVLAAAATAVTSVASSRMFFERKATTTTTPTDTAKTEVGKH